MTRNKVSAFTHCKMEELMRGGGLMENNMESEHFTLRIVSIVNCCSICFIAKTGVMKQKKGIWEDGQRIMWLDNQTLISKIDSGELDYRTLMNKE